MLLFRLKRYTKCVNKRSSKLYETTLVTTYNQIMIGIEKNIFNKVLNPENNYFPHCTWYNSRVYFSPNVIRKSDSRNQLTINIYKHTVIYKRKISGIDHTIKIFSGKGVLYTIEHDNYCGSFGFANNEHTFSRLSISKYLDHNENSKYEYTLYYDTEENFIDTFNSKYTYNIGNHIVICSKVYYAEQDNSWCIYLYSGFKNIGMYCDNKGVLQKIIITTTAATTSTNEIDNTKYYVCKN